MKGETIMEKMLDLDQVNQESLLEGFPNMSMEEISKHLFVSGVMVEVYCGRARLKQSYDFKGFGVDISKTNSSDFANDHMEKGKISLLPLAIEKKLNSIEFGIRSKLKKLAIGGNGKFMPLQDYIEFKEDFELAKKEYFHIRDEIISQWDDIVHNYKEKLSILMSDFGVIEKEIFYNQLIRAIPRKEEYEKSFWMVMNTKTIPIAEENSAIHEEIAKIIERDIVSIIFDTTVTSLSRTFKLCNSAIRNFLKGDAIAPKTFGAIRKESLVLKNRNTVANNPLISELAILLDEAKDASDQDEVISICEFALAKIYCYCEDNGIPLDEKPVIAPSKLRVVANM